MAENNAQGKKGPEPSSPPPDSGSQDVGLGLTGVEASSPDSRAAADGNRESIAGATAEDAALAALATAEAASSSVGPDSPSFALLAALRAQVTDLSSQVGSLNTKLVRSYTRIGDLEDETADRAVNEKRLAAKVAELETDKRKWEAEIARGGWVERVRAGTQLSVYSTRTDLRCLLGTG